MAYISGWQDGWKYLYHYPEDDYTQEPPSKKERVTKMTIAKETINVGYKKYDSIEEAYNFVINKAWTTAKNKNSNDKNAIGKRPILSPSIDPHLACEIRMSDKILRLQNLIVGEFDKVGESVEDTLYDLANYCLLYIPLIKFHLDDEVPNDFIMETIEKIYDTLKGRNTQQVYINRVTIEYPTPDEHLRINLCYLIIIKIFDLMFDKWKYSTIYDKCDICQTVAHHIFTILAIIEHAKWYIGKHKADKAVYG